MPFIQRPSSGARIIVASPKSKGLVHISSKVDRVPLCKKDTPEWRSHSYQTKSSGLFRLKKPPPIIDMPIGTPHGTLDYKQVSKVTFVGASSNTVIDTTTGSLGVGVGVGGPTSNLHVVGNAFISSDLTVSGTGAITLPSGTTAQQPTGVAGMIRFNSTTNRLEVYNGTTWQSMGGVSATGGSIATSGGYKIHTFTSSDPFTVISGGEVDYLVVAGGGAGGTDRGGGGGAGGMLTGSVTLAAGAYNITVGAGGGPSATDANSGGSGSPSSIASLVSADGGGGGGSESTNGVNGGSGGGGAYGRTAGSGTSGQGNAGANGVSNPRRTGGGGGAGAAASAQNGGVGLVSVLSGSSTYYAGGGGGGDNRDGYGVIYGSGGTGGGGEGGIGQLGTGSDGADGYGGGGGGGGYFNYALGGNGGDGIVIIRYLT